MTLAGDELFYPRTGIAESTPMLNSYYNILYPMSKTSNRMSSQCSEISDIWRMLRRTNPGARIGRSKTTCFCPLTVWGD